MIDGIKLTSNSGTLRENIEGCPDLAESRKHIVTAKTGETITIAKRNGLEFTIYSSGLILIHGSLHKYFNGLKKDYLMGDCHNANDFTLKNIEETLQSLADTFGTDILQSKIDSIEFGLNITTPFTAAHFIKQNITVLKVGHRPKNAIVENDIRGQDKGLKYLFTDYRLKIYDKGKMYNLCNDMLRVEYKTVKMRAIKDADIRTLSDVISRPKLQVLFDKLMYVYSHLLVRECIDETRLTSKEINLRDNAFNPDYWRDLTPKLRLSKKAQFKKLYADHAESDIKGDVYRLLDQKYSTLIN